MLSEAMGAVGRDLLELDVAGARARFAAIASLSVAVAVMAALVLQLDDVWWAAISLLPGDSAGVDP